VIAASRTGSSIWLGLRSLLWTLACPGLVAGYLPWRYFGLVRSGFDLSDPLDLTGGACVIGGAALLGACIFEFAHSGHGTLSPLDPPRRLVVRGLYNYVRNPMYLSVSAIVLGEVFITRSAALALYWGLWFAGANIFVIAYEEPALRRQFGPSYDDYRTHVFRWMPRFRAFSGRKRREC
jgi:protein-S-isoprenylcysteine O-methyltransferase Ste14